MSVVGQQQQPLAIGVQPWTRLWEEGHGRAWLADAEYIAEREPLWEHALGLSS